MTIVQKINGALRKIPTWPLYLLSPVPGLLMFYWAVTNQLGADPLQVIERQYGKWALQLLIITLLVTPVRKIIGINFIKFRRFLGLTAFMYVCFHLLVWFVLDKQFFWAEILKDLTKRPFIVIGMVNFVLLLPLALTSNNKSIRKLGPKRWSNLHKLSYIAVLAGAAHYMLVVKAWPLEPMLYVAGTILLVAWRLDWSRFRKTA